jgi:hypothetical protein
MLKKRTRDVFIHSTQMINSAKAASLENKPINEQFRDPPRLNEPSNSVGQKEAEQHSEQRKEYARERIMFVTKDYIRAKSPQLLRRLIDFIR